MVGRIASMLIHFGVDTVHAEWTESVVCVGTFDGVHLGHRRVIETAISHGVSSERPALVVTFDRHPAAILAPERCPPAIATIGEDLRHFEALGAAAAVILPFDRNLANTSAEIFLDAILKDRLKACAAVVGHDFAMGHDRVGTSAWLAERIPTTVVPPFEIDGLRVASSRIRALVAAGSMLEAAKLLGRPFAIDGVVVSGQKLGRTLGFPTINLARSGGQVTPADGVYAGRCQTPFGTFDAAAGIGRRPAVGGGSRTIEAFLLDYPGTSLYGSAVRLELHDWIREERHFESLDALKDQMRKDVEHVRKSLRVAVS